MHSYVNVRYLLLYSTELLQKGPDGWTQVYDILKPNSLYTVHTTCLPASQDSSQHINPLNTELNPICQ